MKSTDKRYLLPRNSLLWLLGSQTLAMAPLMWHLPLWLPAVWICVMVWRLQEFRGRWQRPRQLTKVALVAVCCAGLFLSFGRFLGLEPMVAMLVSAVLLKQLEVVRHRDALLLLLMTFFLIGVQFLFSTALEASLYAILCLWMATSALLAIHQPQGHRLPGRSLRLAGRLLLHSLPLMVLLFLVVPRLGSLWSMPLPNSGARTGVSDSMSPGDFTRLSRSGGVAFRVTFDGPVPAREQLYWRGLVFSRFDGRRWQQAHLWQYRDGDVISWPRRPLPPWHRLMKPQGDRISYSVIIEPSQQPWMYSLGLPVWYSADGGFEIGMARDFRLISSDPLYQRLQYRVSSDLKYQLESEDLPHWRRRMELQLPEGFNPRSIEKAQRWRAEEGSDRAYIQRVLTLYNREFTYTLEPPALGRDTVDDFLERTRRGFCEHFASSFVVMMRAAGIPARVVVGYQGGEYNALENYLVVHQYDAHAWSEVWLPGEGWVRVDPTAAVAPQRIEQSLGEMRAGDVEGTWSLGRYRANVIIANLRLQWDAINYRWHRTVIAFDSNSQNRFFQKLMGDVSPLKMVLFVLFAGFAVLGISSLHLWWRTRPPKRSQAHRLYARFERQLARYGWKRQPGETPGQFARRVAEKNPTLQSDILRLNQSFETLEYAPDTSSVLPLQHALAQFKQSLKGQQVNRPDSRQ
ncbi:DUF3488 domain-containing transglutaminase family protein [Pseudomaricurvus alkylphenolicus]|uniref:transglutaminase TgpA family protein n=1 Tax=Pseudomaricurvus alkylphenolicus TaxID=1306991 RepID=UPI001423ACDD|nr:DUF3488 and transglutaminase-like domain-containing protein [Pseudomaricurvus alkylphenolicus]NIB41318.1 DUF3488 domain-containing transglutaminase family protein [Pseudomaricurvus alkylphenolicus]